MDYDDPSVDKNDKNRMMVYGDSSIYLVPQTETLTVDYFNNLYGSWGEYGQSPYLDEGTNSYIYESGDDIGDGEGLFYFFKPNQREWRDRIGKTKTILRAKLSLKNRCSLMSQ